MREAFIHSLENSDSDHENSLVVDRNMCYACETPYTDDYIECCRCFKRFHLTCVEDENEGFEDLPFECRFC